MEFIERRIGDSNQKSQHSPIEEPTGTGPANGMEHGNAEYPEFRDVSEFADAEVQMTNKI